MTTPTQTIVAIYVAVIVNFPLYYNQVNQVQRGEIRNNVPGTPYSMVDQTTLGRMIFGCTAVLQQ